MPDTDLSDDDDELSLPSVVATVVTGVTLVLAFSLLAVGWSDFWLAFPIGFGGVLPTAVILAKWYEAGSQQETQADTQDSALEALREQYARGEIDEVEFERRVERLLETESLSAENAGNASDATATDPPRETERN